MAASPNAASYRFDDGTILVPLYSHKHQALQKKMVCVPHLVFELEYDPLEDLLIKDRKVSNTWDASGIAFVAEDS